jgi:hypothetical protein
MPTATGSTGDSAHETETSKTVDISSKMGPDVIQIRPSEPSVLETDSSVEAKGDINTKIPPVVPLATPPPATPPPVAITTDATQDAQTDKTEAEKAPTNGLRDIYAEDPTKQDTETEHVVTPPGEDIQYQKLTTGKKETTFMKLKNRIKDLELNLNLSSQ